MLTALQLEQQRRRRPLPSLKQLYHQYILQRIEGYKNSLTRRELLNLGNEAIAEMRDTETSQFVLTEVLIADCVDRLIHRRLGLQPYKRWVSHFKALRSAQREPNHWGIDRRSPVSSILPRLESGDTAVVLGTDAAPIAFLLAAHDVSVVYLGSDLTFVDQIESRVAEEALSDFCTTYVAPVGRWPEELLCRAHVLVIDTAVLYPFSARERREILRGLQDRTEPGGVHLLVPSAHALAPESFGSLYRGWQRERAPAEKRRQARSAGLLLCKPASLGALDTSAESSSSSRSPERTA
jgi:hypothetical protein